MHRIELLPRSVRVLFALARLRVCFAFLFRRLSSRLAILRLAEMVLVRVPSGPVSYRSSPSHPIASLSSRSILSHFVSSRPPTLSLCIACPKVEISCGARACVRPPPAASFAFALTFFFAAFAFAFAGFPRATRLCFALQIANHCSSTSTRQPARLLAHPALGLAWLGWLAPAPLGCSCAAYANIRM
ncbi:hypothetical protein K438DRAFT_1984687 [Mycena galopus ATCC 62051]|nr:hypothetical protein K438DRAFT_1984687 [Mycena galopus ATCC 62051]